jgi:hypothetical protein
MEQRIVKMNASYSALCTEYSDWNSANGLDLGSADEHICDQTLTPDQRKWLSAFMTRWEALATN